MNYIKLSKFNLESITKYILFAIVVLLISSCRTVFKPDVKLMNKLPEKSSVLLLTSCFSVDDKCEDSFDKSVSGILKSELQFQGYKVIIDKNQTGKKYESMSLKQREKVLKSLGANGVVLTTINMLAKETGAQWIVEVQVALKSGLNSDVVWVTKCKHESYWNEDNSWSIEEATRCAMKGLKKKLESGEPINVSSNPKIIKSTKDYPIMLKIQGDVKVSDDFRDGVEDSLTSMGYSMIDEKTQNEALKEQAEQQKSDCYDDTCLVDTGKMLAAKGLIIVSIDKKAEKSFKFKARFIDFEKGTTIKSTSQYFEYSLKNYKEMMNFGRTLTKTLLTK